MSERQLIADLLSALEYHTEQTRPIQFSKVAIEAAREYLRKPVEQAQPVAHVNSNGVVRGAPYPWGDKETLTPLYTAPPPRQPLMEEAIATVYWGVTGQSLKPQDNAFAHKFARAIEAAHGIKEKNT